MLTWSRLVYFRNHVRKEMRPRSFDMHIPVSPNDFVLKIATFACIWFKSFNNIFVLFIDATIYLVNMFYLCLVLVRISICSWKSQQISWCFFFRMWAVSSDSRCTSSNNLRNFRSSTSRLRLIENWLSAPPSASSRRSDIWITCTLRSAFSRSI